MAGADRPARRGRGVPDRGDLLGGHQIIFTRPLRPIRLLAAPVGGLLISFALVAAFHVAKSVPPDPPLRPENGGKIWGDYFRSPVKAARKYAGRTILLTIPPKTIYSTTTDPLAKGPWVRKPTDGGQCFQFWDFGVQQWQTGRNGIAYYWPHEAGLKDSQVYDGEWAVTDWDGQILRLKLVPLVEEPIAR